MLKVQAIHQSEDFILPMIRDARIILDFTLESPTSVQMGPIYVEVDGHRCAVPASINERQWMLDRFAVFAHKNASFAFHALIHAALERSRQVL